MTSTITLKDAQTTIDAVLAHPRLDSSSNLRDLLIMFLAAYEKQPLKPLLKSEIAERLFYDHRDRYLDTRVRTQVTRLRDFLSKYAMGLEGTRLPYRMEIITEARLGYILAFKPQGGLQEQASQMEVFLCHSSADKPQVRELYKRLGDSGFDPWLDEEKLLPGSDWDPEIKKAVRRSEIVLVCLSKSSVTKQGFVQKEIKFALDVAEEKPEGLLYIIPVRLEDCVVPERLSRWHWVDLFSDTGYSRLVRSLKFRSTSCK